MVAPCEISRGRGSGRRNRHDYRKHAQLELMKLTQIVVGPHDLERHRSTVSLWIAELTSNRRDELLGRHVEVGGLRERPSRSNHHVGELAIPMSDRLSGLGQCS